MNDDLNYYIACSRLQSKRQRKRALLTDRDKQLVALYRELKMLKKQLSNPPTEALTSPVQCGWKRSFVLRDDVARSTEAPFFERLLEKLNTTQYSRYKNFEIAYSDGLWRFDRRFPQTLKEFDHNSFHKLGLSAAEKSFFYGFRCYVFKQPWRFVLRVQPNLLRTHVIKRYDLETRRDEIDAYLRRNNLYPRLQRILGHSLVRSWRCSDLEKYKSPLKNISLSVFLEENWPQQSQIQNPRIDPGVSFLLHAALPSISGRLQRHVRPPVKRKLLFPGKI